jgi:hypothetical protein
MGKPLMPNGGFQHQTEGDDFIVKGFSGRSFSGRLPVALVVRIIHTTHGCSVHSIFLHLSCCDLRKAQLTEERQKVDAQTDGMPLRPFLAALTRRNDLIFAKELPGSISEGLFVSQNPGLQLAAQSEIPILGNLLGERQTVLFGRLTTLLATYRGRALPITAFCPAIELNFPT